MKIHPLMIVAVLLLAFALRLGAATDDVRLHPDEALYSTYARSAAVFGAWMLDGPVDKPPVSLYANALSQHFIAARQTESGVIDVPLRAGEFAAKWPNVIAGMLAVALVMAWARSAGDRRGDWRAASSAALSAALSAASLMAVAAYPVAYSASAFTDMLMVTFALGGIVAAHRGRAGFGGLLLALSIATKPQAVFFLPLLWLALRDGDGGRWRALAALALGLAALMLWDVARPEDSLFALGSANINQGRWLADPADWSARAGAWLTHAGGLFGHPSLSVFAAFSVLWGIWRGGMARWLALWCAAFFTGHIISALPTFDRYLLPLVAPLCLLMADALRAIIPRRPRYAVAVTMMLLALISPHDPRADTFRPPDEAALIQAADWLNSREMGAIIYDHWLGWQTGYYMGAWTDKRRVYYPSPSALVADARENPDRAPRYLLAPDTPAHDVAEWLAALRADGWRVSLAYADGGLRVYRLWRDDWE